MNMKQDCRENDYKQKIINMLLEDDFLPLNMDFFRSNRTARLAANSLLDDGTIRMRNCEGAAIELNR